MHEIRIRSYTKYREIAYYDFYVTSKVPAIRCVHWISVNKTASFDCRFIRCVPVWSFVNWNPIFELIFKRQSMFLIWYAELTRVWTEHIRPGYRLVDTFFRGVIVLGWTLTDCFSGSFPTVKSGSVTGGNLLVQSRYALQIIVLDFA